VPHSRTEQFFALADNLPVLLRTIETGRLNEPAMAKALYMEGDPQKGEPENVLRTVVQEVTTNWSIATGRDLKGAVTAPNARLAPRRPLAPRVPELIAGVTAAQAPAPASSTNGVYNSAVARPVG